MFQATEQLAEAFEAAGIRFRVEDTSDRSLIAAEVATDYTAYIIRFISSSDSNDVAVRVHHYICFTKKQEMAVLRAANTCNRRYRFCKFAVNSEAKAVTVEYDLPTESENLGEAAVEIFKRFAQISNETYPIFIREIWGNDEPEKEYASLGNIEFHDFEV